MKHVSTFSLLIFILIFNADFILAQDGLNQNIPADKISDELDAFSLQKINPIPSSIERPLDPNAVEEVFGADSALFGPSGLRGRGNIFYCNNPRTIIEHKFYLRFNTVANLWFVIYEGDSLNATYNLVSSVSVPSQGPGLGWYSSGPINYPLQNGKYYLIYTQWDSAAVYYNDQGVTPYPVQCSFGEQVSGIGWFWTPTYTVPPPATQNQTGEIPGTGVSYYQTIVTEVPPSAPTGLTATPVSESEIQLTWTDGSDNESGFEIQRRAGIVYTTIDVVGENVTTYTDPGRTPGTEYCYRIRAINLAGNSLFTSDACATTANLPSVPNLTSPANNATGVLITPTLSWETGTNTTSYSIQISLNNTFTNAITFPVNTTTFTIPAQNSLPHNTTFYWRVRGLNGTTPGDWSSIWSFTTISTMNLNSTITFPDKVNPGDYSATDYKIVGLPGNGNISVSTILSGSQGTDWEVYYDNGLDSNYYVKFNNSALFNYTTGKAFWIIRKGNLTINRDVTAAPVNTSGYVEINLANEDFNLITNPFLVGVAWSNVLTLNGLPPNTPLRQFNGGWSNTITMQPFTGYLFDNVTDLSTLRIPYPISGSSLPKQNNNELWRVTVDLICGELFDKTTAFGVSEDALQEYDKHDFRKPRAPGNIPVVYFHRPGWDKGYGYYATDIRPDFEELQVWDLKVNSELRKQMNLAFNGISDVPEQMEIYLIDEDRSKSVNLREQTYYEFTPIKSITDFKILVGKGEYINSILSNLMPTEFELGNNFPNPFNPITTFLVSIPQSSEISLTVYNILGEEVKTLYRGTAEAGKHWFQWDGKDNHGLTVPSGIYFYNMTGNNGINMSKKMVLMK